MVGASYSTTRAERSSTQPEAQGTRGAGRRAPGTRGAGQLAPGEALLVVGELTVVRSEAERIRDQGTEEGAPSTVECLRVVASIAQRSKEDDKHVALRGFSACSGSFDGVLSEVFLGFYEAIS